MNWYSSEDFYKFTWFECTAFSHLLVHMNMFNCGIHTVYYQCTILITKCVYMMFQLGCDYLSSSSLQVCAEMYYFREGWSVSLYVLQMVNLSDFDGMKEMKVLHSILWGSSLKITPGFARHPVEWPRPLSRKKMMRRDISSYPSSLPRVRWLGHGMRTLPSCG